MVRADTSNVMGKGGGGWLVVILDFPLLLRVDERLRYEILHPCACRGTDQVPRCAYHGCECIIVSMGICEDFWQIVKVFGRFSRD
jgi:hypothetical protein